MASEHCSLKSVSFQTDRTRRKILLAYWVVVLLAIPLWWVTTNITRLSLPEERVMELEKKQLKFPLIISIPEPVEKEVENGLKRRIQDTKVEDSFTLAVSSAPPQGSQTPFLRVLVDKNLPHTYLEDKQLIFGDINLTDPKLPSVLTNTLADLLLHNATNNQLTVQYSSRYRLAFSLMSEDAALGDSPLDWDVKRSITCHIEPVIEQLSDLHSFTIESQVQYYAPLAFAPIKLGNGAYGLTQEQLSIFVNSAEWTLSSGVSNDPVLHFIIFVPSAQRRPLRVLDNDDVPTESNAFIIPQWGSIYIYNPPDSFGSETTNERPYLTTTDLRGPFTIFRDQLLNLLGVLPLPADVAIHPPEDKGYLHEWQLDSLLRKRAFENMEETRNTLFSIVNLVKQISGMPVGKEVTDDVRHALDALEKMYVIAATSPRLALQYSSKALELASRAFFNPGMLALLYFPPEHNVAVYTSLLVPVGLPLVAAVLKEVAAWRKSRRQT